ncbi:hypothetical protein Tco_1184126 [Tanacetum coccineum]
MESIQPESVIASLTLLEAPELTRQCHQCTCHHRYIQLISRVKNCQEVLHITALMVLDGEGSLIILLAQQDNQAPLQSNTIADNLKTDGDMCIDALSMSTMEPSNVKEAMTDSGWIDSMQEELL